MSYSDYNDINEVILEFDITLSLTQVQQVLPEGYKFFQSPYLSAILADFKNPRSYISEASARENVIAPILKHVFHQKENFQLFSEVTLNVSSTLNGRIDFICAKPIGYSAFTSPILVVAEAKRKTGDMESALAQCAAELIATQRYNKNDHQVLGIVTNGKLWQLLSIHKKTLTLEQGYYQLRDETDLKLLCYVLEKFL